MASRDVPGTSRVVQRVREDGELELRSCGGPGPKAQQFTRERASELIQKFNSRWKAEGSPMRMRLERKVSGLYTLRCCERRLVSGSSRGYYRKERARQLELVSVAEFEKRVVHVEEVTVHRLMRPALVQRYFSEFLTSDEYGPSAAVVVAEGAEMGDRDGYYQQCAAWVFNWVHRKGRPGGERALLNGIRKIALYSRCRFRYVPGTHRGVVRVTSDGEPVFRCAERVPRARFDRDEAKRIARAFNQKHRCKGSGERLRVQKLKGTDQVGLYCAEYVK